MLMAEAGYPKNSNTFPESIRRCPLFKKKKKNPNLQKIHSGIYKASYFDHKEKKKLPNQFWNQLSDYSQYFGMAGRTLRLIWNTVCSSDKDINMEKVEQEATKW